MQQYFLTKFIHLAELTFIFFTIRLQPAIGIIGGVLVALYYLEMLKLNIVDPKFGGSWKSYIKSKFKK